MSKWSHYQTKPGYHKWRHRKHIGPFIDPDGRDRLFYDLGANAGYHMREAEKLGYKAKGVDIDQQSVDLSPDLDLVQGDVNYLDSLYDISNDAFINILRFCEKDQRSNTVVLLTAGAITESLYLAVHMVDDYGTADLLLQQLSDQKYTVDNFMLFASSLKSDDPEVISVLNDLATIKEIFDGIEPGTGGVTIKPAADQDEKLPKKLVIGGSGSKSQPHLSEEEFIALKQAVVELRNNAVIVK